MFGRVTGATIEDNTVVLSVGDINVPMESVLRVQQTKTAETEESDS
jgi:hypothetical protein